MAEWENKVKKESQPCLTEAEITEPVEGEPTIIPPGTGYRAPRRCTRFRRQLCIVPVAFPFLYLCNSGVRSSYSALRRKTIQCCFTEFKKSNDDVFAAYTDETRMSGGPLGRAYVILQSLNINTTTKMMPER